MNEFSWIKIKRKNPCRNTLLFDYPGFGTSWIVELMSQHCLGKKAAMFALATNFADFLCEVLYGVLCVRNYHNMVKIYYLYMYATLLVTCETVKPCMRSRISCMRCSVYVHHKNPTMFALATNFADFLCEVVSRSFVRGDVYVRTGRIMRAIFVSHGWIWAVFVHMMDVNSFYFMNKPFLNTGWNEKNVYTRWIWAIFVRRMNMNNFCSY